MTRLDAIRKNGAIPERRHDAFLLALLLAVGFNVAFFAAQALLPRLAALLQSLGAGAPVAREEEMPFVLVDPSLLDEEVRPDSPAATSAVNRAARQPEGAPAEGEDVYRPEGVDEQPMMAEGNPGEIDPGVDSAGLPDIEEIGAEANVDSDAEDAPDATESAMEEPEPASGPAAEAAPAPEPVEAPPVPEPPPEPQPPVEEIPEAPPPPQPDEAEEPDILPEPAPEPIDLPPEPVPQVIEPEIEPTPGAEPVAEVIDLASLPVTDGGMFDPETQTIRERARQAPPVAAPAPEQFAEREYFRPETRPERPVPRAVDPAGPVRPERRNRAGVTAPPIKRVGGAGTAGGAPPRRSAGGRRETDLFDDPYMALLRDKYPEYMTKLGRLLQDSLNRTMVLYPSYYASGRALLFFRLSPDGRIEWHETQYPVDGSDNTLRTIAERTLLEAGPFDPPPAAMLADPAFRRMSLTVTIYQ